MRTEPFAQELNGLAEEIHLTPEQRRVVAGFFAKTVDEIIATAADMLATETLGREGNHHE